MVLALSVLFPEPSVLKTVFWVPVLFFIVSTSIIEGMLPPYSGLFFFGSSLRCWPVFTQLLANASLTISSLVVGI